MPPDKKMIGKTEELRNDGRSARRQQREEVRQGGFPLTVDDACHNNGQRKQGAERKNERPKQ
jgi:hypothetical protein